MPPSFRGPSSLPSQCRSSHPPHRVQTLHSIGRIFRANPSGKKIIPLEIFQQRPVKGPARFRLRRNPAEQGLPGFFPPLQGFLHPSRGRPARAALRSGCAAGQGKRHPPARGAGQYRQCPHSAGPATVSGASFTNTPTAWIPGEAVLLILRPIPGKHTVCFWGQTQSRCTPAAGLALRYLRTGQAT